METPGGATIANSKRGKAQPVPSPGSGSVPPLAGFSWLHCRLGQELNAIQVEGLSLSAVGGVGGNPRLQKAQLWAFPKSQDLTATAHSTHLLFPHAVWNNTQFVL
jgi:hypothetical protein